VDECIPQRGCNVEPRLKDMDEWPALPNIRAAVCKWRAVRMRNARHALGGGFPPGARVRQISDIARHIIDTHVEPSLTSYDETPHCGRDGVWGCDIELSRSLGS